MSEDMQSCLALLGGSLQKLPGILYDDVIHKFIQSGRVMYPLRCIVEYIGDAKTATQ
jgi:hypothetical protein